MDITGPISPAMEKETDGIGRSIHFSFTGENEMDETMDIDVIQDTGINVDHFTGNAWRF